MTKEMVQRPNHYTSLYPIECRNLNCYLNSYLSNTLKYLYRWDTKGVALTDLRKAREYLKYFTENPNKVPIVKLSKLQQIDLDYMLNVIESEAFNKLDEERFYAIKSLFKLNELHSYMITSEDMLGNETLISLVDYDKVNDRFVTYIATIEKYIEDSLQSLKEK